MNIFTSNELSLTQEAKKMNLWEAFAMCLLNIDTYVEGYFGPRFG